MDKFKRDQAAFDVEALTADEMQDFFEATSKNDLRAIAEIFAKTATKIPAEWGKMDDPMTYRKLPYVKFFKPLLAAFVDEFSGKNY